MSSTTTPAAHVVTITRPGHSPVHLGYATRYEAELAVERLTFALTYAVHVEGTFIDYADGPIIGEILEPVPTSPVELADLIDPAAPVGPDTFPDLFVRLSAQIGTRDATAVWWDANSIEVQRRTAAEDRTGLGVTITKALTAVSRAIESVRNLNDCHPSYDGTNGADLAAHLADAARALRAAILVRDLIEH